MGRIGISLVAVVWAAAAAAADQAVKHPVFAATESVATVRSRLAPVLGLSEAQLEAAVPETNGLAYVRCPACDAGAQDDQLVWNGPADPRGVHCRYCGTNFPNAKYPETEKITVADPTGEKRDFRFLRRPDGRECFLDARADFFAKKKMADFAQDFGDAYLLTGDREYAHRAALLLGRFAAVFPHYMPWHELPERGQTYPLPVRDPPQPSEDWNQSFWSTWSYEMIPTPLLYAYDAIYSSGELEKISSDLKARIEHNIFDRSLGFQLAFPDHLTNAQPYTYRDYTVAGLVLGRPELIQLALRRSRLLIQTEFFYDGFWKEDSPSYHRQVLNNLRQFFRLIAGRLPGLEADEAQFARLDRAVDLLSDPSGNEVRLADAWGQKLRQPLLPDGGVLWGGLGLARLGYGPGERMMQSYLNFTGKYGHEHADALALTLFAGGQELLPDIGYTHTQLRDYAATTMSHNTVRVDGAPSVTRRGTPGGRLQRFSPFPDGPQMVEATDPAAYPQLREYRRRLVQIPFSVPGWAYVVDTFWAQGGTKYDYFLHGSADRQSRADLSVALGGNPLELEPNFVGVREGRTEGAFQATWTPPGTGGPGLRSTILGEPGTDVFLGLTPQVRPAGNDDSQLSKFWRPSLMVRREGSARQEATFVAVHEPFLGHPSIRSVTALGSSALRIEHAEGVDCVITAKEPEALTIPWPGGGPIEFHGVQAVLRFDLGGALRWAYLYDVDRLQVGDLGLSLPPPVTGRLLLVRRDPSRAAYSFLVDGSAPDLEGLAGAPVLVIHGDSTTHGYSIRRAQAEGGGFEAVLDDDPGFEIGKGLTQFLTFPENQIAGANRVRIDSIAFVRMDGTTLKVSGNAPVTWRRGGRVQTVFPRPASD